MKISNLLNVDYSHINSLLTNFNKKLRLDIGTSISAPVTRHWFNRLNDIVCIGIEPNPDCVYKENHWNNGIYNIINVFENHPQKDFYYHIIGAVDDVDNLTLRKFNVLNGNVGCSSLLEPIWPFKGCELDKVIDVETFPLKSLLKNIDFKLIELIKIDTQGKDLDIIKSAGDYIKKVCYIDMEDDCTKGYKGAADRNSILEYMKKFDFELYKIESGNLRFKNIGITIPNNFNNITGDM